MSVTTANATQSVAKTTVPTRKKVEKLLVQYATAAEAKTKIEATAKAQAADLGVEMATIEVQLKAYADAWRSEVPKGQKFLTVGTARLGWSLTPGKVVTELTYSEKKVRAFIEETLPRAMRTEVDMDVVKSVMKVDEAFAAQMKKLGITIQASEKFYVKLNTKD